MNLFRILVYGIGGVGGFFGGKLAQYYAESGEVEVDFIARGPHLEAIRENGLQLITDAGLSVVHPNRITDDPRQLGKYDLILLTTKTYNLDQSVRAIVDNCKPGTLLLPLQNGVDNTLRIQMLDPPCFVLEGLVYLIAYKSGPGQITQSGAFKQLMFGSTNEHIQPFLHKLEGLFQQAGLEASFRADIREQIWEKYLLISALGSLTSYTRTPIADLLENPEYFKLLLQILSELYQLARAAKVNLPEDIIATTLKKIRSFRPDATTSMQRDFEDNMPTELESLCGYVVKRSAHLGLKTPGMRLIYNELRNRLSG